MIFDEHRFSADADSGRCVKHYSHNRLRRIGVQHRVRVRAQGRTPNIIALKMHFATLSLKSRARHLPRPMKQNLGDLAEDGVAFCFDTIFETLSEINESLVSARLVVPDGISWLFEESVKRLPVAEPRRLQHRTLCSSNRTHLHSTERARRPRF